MGAKQSKRSVDISGKEAESAGEVAVGAGGEGRLEQLADADSLKPQINGDAHILEQTDKEKQLDVGTPENEKDATTEKEGKQEESESDKEVTPVTNGEGEEPKPENGESPQTTEDTKKPKKEKVKKKWSLRSISFSRKEKPKQEKKTKEEDSKTNGEPEKVPEETVETSAEVAITEVSEVKTDPEVVEEKTPDTPVLEPITNGTSTPESPKADIPLAEKTAPVAVIELEKPETKVEPEPEKLPLNGLSLQEPTVEVLEEKQTEESKPEESQAVIAESAPAIEIPVQKEVCVEPMPLESTPPPLPANPPPSSVASFAATTMAPDSTVASLANTAETTISTPPLDTKTDSTEERVESLTVISNDNTDVKDNTSTNTPDINNFSSVNTTDVKDLSPINTTEELVAAPAAVNVTESIDVPAAIEVVNVIETQNYEICEKQNIPNLPEEINTPVMPELSETLESETSLSLAAEDVLPPPPLEEDISVDDNEISETMEPIPPEICQEQNLNNLNCNYINGDVVTNGAEEIIANDNEETEQENTKNKIKNIVKTTEECNGNIEMKEEVNGDTTEQEAPLSEDGAEALPPPPEALPQDDVPMSDKIADLIPEVPIVPDLSTETETSVATVAN